MRWFWVDRFTEYVAGSHATGVKGVALSDDYIHGHWDIYPALPNSLAAEGMAQTAGLLVSELYGFRELVVLAKFTRIEFHDLARPGELLRYHATIGRKVDAGAQCEVTSQAVSVDGSVRPHAEAEVFFARLSASGEPTADGQDPSLPSRLFDPEDLVRWLHTTGVFAVGVREDGERMRPEDYGLPVLR